MDVLGPHREQYTVGWVCALPTELAAAKAMLEKTYPVLPARNTRDSNVYVFGSVCDHNVVIASLPVGSYGTTSAAITAKEMFLRFPSIRFGLLVGVGGGLPSAKNDIRLGDVVVSKPDGVTGGVLQFDLGKDTNAGFERTGSLNRPPSILLMAVAQLESDHILHGSTDVSDSIDAALNKFPELKSTAERPESEKDMLFEATYNHVEGNGDCQLCDDTRVVARVGRGTPNPVIHYGLIGSSNSVIRSPRTRDLLKSQNIMCVEMEAAGLMNDFPCIVIRGISDYCDGHKNDEWQPYAALAAAAYAKELLKKVPVLEVEAAPAAPQVLRETIDEIKEDVKEIYQRTQDSHQEARAEKIRRWLSPADPCTNQKQALGTHHSGSGAWFLESQQYSHWNTSQKSSLWLHGSSGCGKTVLTSLIVDRLQQEIHSCPLASARPILLYFFFDFRDDKKQSLEQMAFSLAYQLYGQDMNYQQSLDSLSKADHDCDRKPQTETLLGMILTTLQTTDRNVYLILDAVDECTIPRQNLLAWIKEVAGSATGRIHLLATSRKEPDVDKVLGRADVMEQIVSIPKDVVDEDIRAYIIHRVQTDDGFQRWKHREDIQHMIRKSLMGMSGGMFRWAACQLDVLSTCTNPLTLGRALNMLPPTLDDTYCRMLQSIPDAQKDDAIRLLQLLVNSSRPLHLEEAVDAMAINLAARPYFDPQNCTPVPSEIIGSCSGLVTIERSEESGEVLQLAHFSVQQYLKSEKVDPAWRHAMSKQQAMASNAKLCLAYCFQLRRTQDYYGDEYFIIKCRMDRPFLLVAARTWTQYAMQVETYDSELWAMIQRFLLSDELKRARFYWFYLKERYDILSPDREWYQRCFQTGTQELRPLAIAAACGLYHSVRSMLLCGADPNEEDRTWVSALCAASYAGHDNIVGLLLDHGARPNTRSGRVNWNIIISSRGYIVPFEPFQTLSQRDARSTESTEVKSVDGLEMQSIRSATRYGSSKEGQTLQEYMAAADAADAVDLNDKSNGRKWASVYGTAFELACREGHIKVIRTLLSYEATTGRCFESNERICKPSLEAACRSGKAEIVEALLKHLSADPERLDERRALGLCLVWGCILGHEKIVKYLFKYNVDVNAHDDRYGSPLIAACMMHHCRIVLLLLRHGADVNQAEISTHYSDQVPICRTPLLHTILVGSIEGDKPPFFAERLLHGVQTLIAAGANVNRSDDQGQTPLHYAALYGQSVVMGVLIKACAFLDSLDGIGQTPLIKAADVGAKECVKILLRAGARTDIQDSCGRTALHYAAQHGRLAICRMLVKSGASLDVWDNHGLTPLQVAEEEGHYEVVALFRGTLQKGVMRGLRGREMQAEWNRETRELMSLEKSAASRKV